LVKLDDVSSIPMAGLKAHFKELERSAALEALDFGFAGELIAELTRLPSCRRRRVAELIADYILFRGADIL
jgi:hypothetical protein